MTISDLIQLLQKYPSETRIMLQDQEGYPANLSHLRLDHVLDPDDDRGSVFVPIADTDYLDQFAKDLEVDPQELLKRIKQCLILSFEP